MIAVALASLSASIPMLMTIELIGLSLGLPLPESAAFVLTALLEIGSIGAAMLTVFALVTSKKKASYETADGGSAAALTTPALKQPPGSAHNQESTLPHDIVAGLGPGFDSKLLWLQADGHYCRAHGMHQSAFLSMSFGHAVSLLRDQDGAVVHRSTWVAKSAVSRAIVKEGKITLILINGDSVPVARRRRQRLKDKGWPV
ncbi:MAG: LytTR family DNA-binding domain-containing protein [Pseudomonadota bacterium]